MNLNNLIFIIIGSVSSVLAQDIGITEVKVIENFKPVITEVKRLNENANFADTIKRDRSQTYEMMDVSLISDYKLEKLLAAKVKNDRIIKLYTTKVGIGFGSSYNALSSFVHNSNRSENLSYSIIANHASNKYDVAKTSKNTLNLYAKRIYSDFILFANLDYDRRVALYHDKNFNYNMEKFYINRFAYTKFSFSAMSKIKDKNKLQHNTIFFISDLNEFSENQVHLSSNFSKKLYGLPFKGKIEINEYVRYKSAPNIINSDFQIFSTQAATSLSYYGINFDFSLDFNFINYSYLNFFPQINVTKELVNDILFVYGGLRYSKIKHTLKSLSDDNPYIHSFGTNQSILNDSILLNELRLSNTQELYLGIKNFLDNDELFEASIAYGFVDNLEFFDVVDHPNYNRFLIRYLDLYQLHISSNYQRPINQIISLRANIDYYSWEKKIFNKPNLTINLSSPINLRNKIKISPSISYVSKMNNNDYFITELPARLHLDLSSYYFYSRQLSAYLILNNLTNSKKDILMGYREIGFNLVLGLNFSF